MQIIGGVPTDWRPTYLLAVPTSEVDPLYFHLRFLPGCLRNRVLPVYLLLCGGRNSGNSHSQTVLFQEPLELPGYSHNCGECETESLNLFCTGTATLLEMYLGDVDFCESCSPCSSFGPCSGGRSPLK